MCLGVPGRVTKIEIDEFGMTMGTVDFGGISKQACLDCLPEVRIGDYVVVHVGFALSRIDEHEALEVFELLREAGELAELDIPQPEVAPPAAADAAPRGPRGTGP